MLAFVCENGCKPVHKMYKDYQIAFVMEIYVIVHIVQFKVMGNALNIDIIFGGVMTVLLIHDEVPFHFMVSISDEYKYKYKRLVKTTFKSCGRPIFLEIYHTCIHQKCQFSAQFSRC